MIFGVFIFRKVKLSESKHSFSIVSELLVGFFEFTEPLASYWDWLSSLIDELTSFPNSFRRSFND